MSRIIYNNIIPVKDFTALTLWPFVFIREGMAWAYDEKTDRHEHIHGSQQMEMFAVGTVIAAVLFLFGCGWWSLAALPLFFYWYVVEWLMRWAYYRNRDKAYKNVSFEREAYNNEADMDYLRTRKHYAFLKLL